MEVKTLGFCTLFLWIQCFILLEAHDHLPVGEITTIRYNETDGDGSFIPLLKCLTDSECSLSPSLAQNNTRILSVCDTAVNRCKCPTTFNGVHVMTLNGSCNLAHQIGDPCKNDAECSGNVAGSLCSKQGTCQCPHGEMPERQGRTESCPTEMPGFDQLNTFKWVFIFILVGYPVITGLFAIFEKEKDDHWFYEKIASVIDCRKKLNQQRKDTRRRAQNRRNTEEDFMSTDDDESPLEMEIV